MSLVKVMDSNGQVVLLEQDSIVYNDFTRATVESGMPTDGYIVVCVSASNGLDRTCKVPLSVWTNMIATLETKVDDNHAHEIADVNLLQSGLDTLTAGVATKFTTPTGSTSQYVRGNGTLATFPSAVDITGKSDKASFSALGTLAVHGRSNGVTTNATNLPNDAVTNYNVVTTLLGTLTSAVNAANAKQNDIGVNVNTLSTNVNAFATQFNALLTWLGLSQSAINNLKTAGAA